jgi:primase-polymerase (primpol)-like protein
MKKMQTSQVQSERPLSGHSNECIVSRTTFFDNSIPQEPKAYPHGILWKHEQWDGRLTKVPDLVPGYTRSITSPETWADFEIASAILSKDADTYSGLGFGLTEGDFFIFFDCDDSSNSVTGESEPSIWEEFTSLNNYAEISQNDEVVHVIATGISLLKEMK